MFLFIFEGERDRAWAGEEQRERGRHRIWSRLQAPSHQPRAGRGARTHELGDHDLSRSRTLSRLSHPGAPPLTLFFGLLLLGVYLYPRGLNCPQDMTMAHSQSLFWCSNCRCSDCLRFGSWHSLQAGSCVLFVCPHHSLSTSLFVVFCLVGFLVPESIFANELFQNNFRT